MKKIILTFGIVLVGLFTASAQDTTGVTKEVNKIISEYTSVAQFTPEETSKIRPILVTFVTTKKDNKEKYAQDAAGLKTANRTNRENLKAQMETVLTAEQMQKIEDYNKAKKAKSRNATGQE